MSFLLTVARKIRHAPLLRRLDPLWRVLRPLYHRALDPRDRGVVVRLGGVPVRLPPELLSTNPNWPDFERESFAALAGWLDQVRGQPTMLDIGCSFGLVTSFAVQVHPQIEVLAFDSDFISLRAMEAVVPAESLGRVRRIQGLLGTEHRSGRSLEEAIADTAAGLPALAPRPAIMRSGFVCLGDEAAAHLPQHQLDRLLAGVTFPGPVLLKCDVEGAEQLVLSGAGQVLRAHRPFLLLSVHPPYLPRYGQSVDDVSRYLLEHGYTHRIIARDHEEHWWCEPR